MSDGKATSN